SNVNYIIDIHDRYMIPRDYTTQIRYRHVIHYLFTTNRILCYHGTPAHLADASNGESFEERGGESMNWNWDVFAESFPIIIKGLHITIALTFSSFLFALVFGFVWIFLRRIPFKLINWLVTWTMEFIRSTPPLVQLFFIYFALPMIPGIHLALSP